MLFAAMLMVDPIGPEVAGCSATVASPAWGVHCVAETEPSIRLELVPFEVVVPPALAPTSRELSESNLTMSCVLSAFTCMRMDQVRTHGQYSSHSHLQKRRMSTAVNRTN